jgi:predicted enzyme related to lactoylglutathione lyase
MAERTEYAPNTFCWPELTTTDGAGAKKFYEEVFGWELTDNPVGPDVVYTMATLRGKNVGAMYEMNEEQRRQHLPPHWLSYVSVESVDDMLAKAKKLGGNVTVEAMDVFDVGRMAAVQDPQGAVFALWQPKAHIGAELVNEPGTFCWNELYTNDVDGSGGFYTKLFNWGSNTAEMGPGQSYTSFMNGERPAGGMIEIQKEWGEVPTNWSVYFAVDDCDKTAGKVVEMGGTIESPPMDIPEVGRFAVCCDPQGAHFAIIKMINPQD